MDSKELAKYIRQTSLRLVSRANASHIGGSLSMADILAVLYADVMRYRPDEPDWADRDRLMLSKGHTCVALYSALSAVGFINEALLEEYGTNGTKLLCHVSHLIPGVEMSAGSLGHGLPIAVGMALAGKMRAKDYRTFVILGDGEMDEGANWEALLFASQHKLSNLCAIIDFNHQQAMGDTSTILNLEPIVDKLHAFGVNVLRVDGHDHDALRAAFATFEVTPDKPTVIVADTIKGKGVSYMENQLKWHYSAPNAELLSQALEELER